MRGGEQDGMNPKVSVLMCVHNGEDFVREAIDSILSQTLSDFEFIIVENASTDATWDIVCSYDDPRIRPLRTSIRQLTFNLNYGLMHARAPYVARMDADDVALPERLARQAAYLDAHPEVAVVGSAYAVFGEGVVERVIHLPETDAAIRRRMPYRHCLCHPATVFRRETVLACGGYHGDQFCQDIELWLRLSRDPAVQFANLAEPLLRYRIHADQSKGQREAFVLSATLLLREALLRKSPRFFTGFLLALLKIGRASK